MLHGSVWYVCCYVGKKALRQFLQGEEGRDMVLYEVPLLVSLLGSVIVTMFANFHVLRVRLFVHVHLLILVYYVFPQLVKSCANSLFDRSL